MISRIIISKNYVRFIIYKKVIINNNKKKNEIKILLELRDALGIKKLKRVVLDSKNVLLLFDYTGGLNLKEYLHKNIICKKDLKDIFLHVVLVLKNCHRRKIVHGDIKLENILIDEKNHIFLVDFGSAVRVGVKPKKRKLKFRGTPFYMAPEVILKSENNGK